MPVASAELENLPTRYVKGEHGSLPNIPAVAQDVLALLTGDELSLAETCQGALVGHLSVTDESSVTPLLDGSTSGSHFRELPEYEHPTPTLRAQVEADLNTGKLPEINLVKILDGSGIGSADENKVHIPPKGIHKKILDIGSRTVLVDTVEEKLGSDGELLGQRSRRLTRRGERQDASVRSCLVCFRQRTSAWFGRLGRIRLDIRF